MKTFLLNIHFRQFDVNFENEIINNYFIFSKKARKNLPTKLTDKVCYYISFVREKIDDQKKRKFVFIDTLKALNQIQFLFQYTRNLNTLKTNT